ncbi:hypothetical protein [Streptococcus orisratti]
MKINKTLMIFLLLIVTSIFCVVPVFIQLNISEDPLKIILSFIGAIPMYYILSQFFHTLLLWITMILFRLKSIYCYFVVLVRLGSKFYFRIFLNHVMGFAPAIAFQYKEGKLPKPFFKVYYLLYFLSMIGYYLLFLVVHRNPLFLPLIPFSIVTAIIQRLYEPEYQQLFMLKSKVLTILESGHDYHFSIKDYPRIWQLSSKSELPFIALSYVSLIKVYLSEEQCKAIEMIENERFDDKGYQMGLYGMLDVIKLNLYLLKNDTELRLRYSKMLNQLLTDKPNFMLVKDGIDAALAGEQDLSISLGISEIQLFMDIYK